MYTYTQRRDVLSYECFAGRVMADGRVYIGEAGTDDSCRRRIDPTRMGMLINKIGKTYLHLEGHLCLGTMPTIFKGATLMDETNEIEMVGYFQF